MNQSDYVDMVEKARLTKHQAMVLRLFLGIDDNPMKAFQIAKKFKVSHQAVFITIKGAKEKIAKLPFIPGEIIGPRRTQPTTNPISKRNPIMMTVAKAEKIIGGSIGLGEKEDGFQRVACYGPNGEVLSETARDIPTALEMLIRTHYAAARAFVLKRDKYRCTNCGSFKQLECDHVESRAKGRWDHPSNLITLCQGCHKIRHGRKKFHLKVGACPESGQLEEGE